MEVNRRKGVYEIWGVDCYSQCPCLPPGLGLVHRLQPSGWHGPGGLAVCSWLPSVRKLLFYQIPDSSPHSFSFLVCTLTAFDRDTTLPHFPLFVGTLVIAGREDSKVNLANCHFKILKSARVPGGQMEAVLSGWYWHCRYSDILMNIVEICFGRSYHGHKTMKDFVRRRRWARWGTSI